MNPLASSRLSADSHSSTSRPAKHGTKAFLGGILLLLCLLVLASSALAQVTLTPATLSFAKQAVGVTSAAKTATLKNGQTVPLTFSHRRPHL